MDMVGVSARVRNFAQKLRSENEGMVSLPGDTMIVVRDGEEGGYYIQVTSQNNGRGPIKNSLYFLSLNGDIFVCADCRPEQREVADRAAIAALSRAIAKFERITPPIKHQPLREFLSRLVG